MSFPTCVRDLEVYANAHLSKPIAGFYSGGSEEEETKQRNISAFRKILLRPSVLSKPVDKVDLSTTLLGGKICVSIPVGIAPTGFQAYAHPDAEIATAKAAAEKGTVMILSGWSNTTLETVKSASAAELWQNVYLYKTRDIAKSLIRRAEKSGFSAIVVSVDIPVLGNRRNRSNILKDQIPVAHFEPNEFEDCLAGDPGATWEDFAEICKFSKLPVVAKGILTGEDAVHAINNGAAAVIVSNHGGRQLDGAPSSIEMLPEIVKAVNGACDVYMDGGVRTGVDVFRALALGAKYVFIGRPVLWGLVFDGENGVKAVFDMLRHELKTTMALTGCDCVADVNESRVMKFRAKY